MSFLRRMGNKGFQRKQSSVIGSENFVFVYTNDDLVKMTDMADQDICTIATGEIHGAHVPPTQLEHAKADAVCERAEAQQGHLEET